MYAATWTPPEGQGPAMERVMARAISEPLEVEVFSHALLAVAEEMGATLIRTARSINIRERLDASCAVFDREGRLLVQAEHHPGHLGALVSMVAATLRRYPRGDIGEGDAFIGNDPYEGGGMHLPDVTVAAPVFFAGQLAGFVVCMGHWPDVGGKAPGAGIEGSTEIYQEGLRVPPIRIARGGVVDVNLLDLLLANTRTAEENRLDFHAQLACLHIGARGVQDIIRRYSVARYERLCEDTVGHSEMLLRRALSALPEVEVSADEYLDDDGFDDTPVHLAVRIRLVHAPAPHLVFDFTGTDAQRIGGTNGVKAGLIPALSYVLKTLLDPTLVLSAGAFRVVEIVAPEGTVLNCRPPAAVGGKGPVNQRLIEMCYHALSAVLPERVIAGSCGNTAYFFSWYDPRAGRRRIHLEGTSGGMGARAHRDGPDAVQVHTNNMPNMPVEITESEVPVLVERFVLVPDSGGAGRHRGGLSSAKEYRLLSDMLFVPHGDRHRFQPWGLAGGHPGSTGRFSYVRDGAETKLPSKGEGLVLRAGDLLRIRAPGGGGYGEPAERDLRLVERDVRERKITLACARELYGFENDPEATAGD